MKMALKMAAISSAWRNGWRRENQYGVAKHISQRISVISISENSRHISSNRKLWRFSRQQRNVSALFANGVAWQRSAMYLAMLIFSSMASNWRRKHNGVSQA
jgi:hypothetical protein